MSGPIIRSAYEEPPICEREILRYAGCHTASEDMQALMRECLSRVRSQLCYRAVYRELPLSISADVCDVGVFSCRSQQLAKTLRGCDRVVVMAATVGVEIDRLIARYGHIAPSKAVMLQAIGAERIEALCDTVCKEIAERTASFVRPRFSPGYGDLPLEVQCSIVSVLDTPKHIGLTLNDSLLMSPSKSVTAFVGLSSEAEKQPKSKCALCTKQDCAFRGAL